MVSKTCHVHGRELQQDLNGIPFCRKCRETTQEEMQELLRSKSYLAALAKAETAEAQYVD